MAADADLKSRVMMTAYRTLWAVAGVLVALLAGCGDPAAEARIAHRRANLGRTLTLLERLETGRAEKVERFVGDLQRRHQKDVTETSRNADRVEEWLRKDFERWRQRWPIHEREIQERMKGNLPNAERTLPRVLY